MEQTKSFPQVLMTSTLEDLEARFLNAGYTKGQDNIWRKGSSEAKVIEGKAFLGLKFKALVTAASQLTGFDLEMNGAFHPPCQCTPVEYNSRKAV